MENLSMYQHGKIYTVRSFQTDKFYIGATVQSLAKRYSLHRNHYKSYKEGIKKEFISAYDILQYDDNYIELLELFPCNSKIELSKREGELIRQLKDSVVNLNIAGRSVKEYYNDNIIKIKDISSQFRQDNPSYNKNYYEANKEAKLKILTTCGCGGKYSIYSKSLHMTRYKHINWINKPTIETVIIIPVE